MIDTKSTINAAAVEDLEKAAKTAHSAYSESFERFEEADAALGAAAGVRLSLVQSLEASKAAVASMKRQGINLAVHGDSGFKMAAAKIVALHAECSLLNAAVECFNANGYMDALCRQLGAKLQKFEKQHASESARLDLHIATIYAGLGEVARRDGGIKIELGSATDGLKRLVFQIARDAEAARGALKAAEIEARELRDQYGQENI